MINPRRPFAPGDDASPRPIMAVLLGRGVLAAHVGLFLIAACVLVLLNLVQTPDRLWFWQPLVRWGIVVVVHAGLVGVASTRRLDQIETGLTTLVPSERLSQLAIRPKAAALLPEATARFNTGLAAADRGRRELVRRAVASTEARRAAKDGQEEAATDSGGNWNWPTVLSTAPSATGDATGATGWLATVAGRLRHQAAMLVDWVRSLWTSAAAVADTPTMPATLPTMADGPRSAGPVVTNGWDTSSAIPALSQPGPSPVAPPVASWPQPSTKAFQRDFSVVPPLPAANEQDVVVAGSPPVPTDPDDAQWKRLEAAASAWLARREAEDAGTGPLAETRDSTTHNHA